MIARNPLCFFPSIYNNIHIIHCLNGYKEEVIVGMPGKSESRLAAKSLIGRLMIWKSGDTELKKVTLF